MNLEDFKSEWRRTHERLAVERMEPLIGEVSSRAISLRQAVRRRDMVEVAAALYVALFLGLFLWSAPGLTLMKTGAVIILLGAVEIVAVLFCSRRFDQRPQQHLPLSQFCRAEIDRLNRQIWLMRNVNWWYSGPLLVGVGVMGLEFIRWRPDLPFAMALSVSVVFYGTIAGIAVWVYRRNAQYVASELVPFRDQLLTLSQSLQEESISTEGR